MEENGVTKTLNKQVEIKTNAQNFYAKLFSNHVLIITQNAQTLSKLSNQQSESMSGHISVDEMTKYLKKSKNNVSPGSSGFKGNFYKFVWLDIKNWVVSSAKYSFDRDMRIVGGTGGTPPEPIAGN